MQSLFSFFFHLPLSGVCVLWLALLTHTAAEADTIEEEEEEEGREVSGAAQVF